MARAFEEDNLVEAPKSSPTSGKDTLSSCNLK